MHAAQHEKGDGWKVSVEVQAMISMGDLLSGAKMRLTLALDMAGGAYQNHYASETYPRLAVVKEGAKGINTTTYYVDGIECADLDAVVAMLNTEPHPDRTNVARHHNEQDT
jgi:hypothetical protein